MPGLDRTEIEDVVRDVLGRYAIAQVSRAGATQIFSPGSAPLFVLNYGASVLQWPGASNSSTPLTVPHGLPGLPSCVIAVLGTQGPDPAINAYPRIYNVTTSTFQISFFDPAVQPAVQASSFFWVAFL